MAASEKPKETRCDGCRHYIPLAEPFHYEKSGYPQGVTVYGFCSKDVTRNFAFYPVYLPDGGICDAFKPKPKQGKKPEQPVDGQMCMEV